MSDVLDAIVTIKQSVVDKEYGRFALLLNRAATPTCCEVNGWRSDGSDGAVMEQ